VAKLRIDEIGVGLVSRKTDRQRGGNIMGNLNLMGISFQQIQIFLKAVELRNYTKTANYFNFTPSMISKTIATMEMELDVSLFTKKSRELIPTTAASVLAYEWNGIITALEKGIEKAKACQNGITSQINIGFIDSSLKVDDLIRQLIDEFCALNHDVEIRVEKFDMHQLVELINTGILDIIITALHETPALDAYKIPWDILFETNYAIYVSKQSKLFDKESISFSDLRDERFIVLSPAQHANYYALFEHLCMENGFTPSIAQTASNVRSMFYNLNLGKGIVFGDSITSDWANDDVKKFILPEKAGTVIAWTDAINEKIADLVAFMRTRFIGYDLN
jgi:DNA-binding transcriptional LysR family regulator